MRCTPPSEPYRLGSIIAGCWLLEVHKDECVLRDSVGIKIPADVVAIIDTKKVAVTRAVAKALTLAAAEYNYSHLAKHIPITHIPPIANG